MCFLCWCVSLGKALGFIERDNVYRLCNRVSKRCSGDWLIADCKVAQERIKIKTYLRHGITLHCCCNNILYIYLFSYKSIPDHVNFGLTWHVKPILNNSGEKVFKHKRKNWEGKSNHVMKDGFLLKPCSCILLKTHNEGDGTRKTETQ